MFFFYMFSSFIIVIIKKMAFILYIVIVFEESNSIWFSSDFFYKKRRPEKDFRRADFIFSVFLLFYKETTLVHFLLNFSCISYIYIYFCTVVLLFL